MNKNYWTIFLIIILIIVGGAIIFLQFFEKGMPDVFPKVPKHLGSVIFITPIENNDKQNPSKTSVRQNPGQTLSQANIISNIREQPNIISNNQAHNPAISNNLVNDPPVNIINFAFSPSSLTVNVGDSVTWTNNDNDIHTVTSDSGNELNSPILQPGDTYSHTFNSPGTFNYHCTIHPFMSGVIFVMAPAPTPVTPPPIVEEPPSPQVPPVVDVPETPAISPVPYPVIDIPVIIPKPNATIIQGSFKGGTARPFQGGNVKPFAADTTPNFRY